MIKSFSKNSLSKNFILPFKKDQRFIFIYHDISETSSVQHSKNYSTTPKKFKEHIAFLSRIFEWVDLDTIHRKKPFKNNVASLTFDDGFKSVESNAFPFLSENKIPFSVFVNRCAIKHNRLWVSDLLLNTKTLEKTYGAEFATELHSAHAFGQLEKNKSFQNRLNSLVFENYKKEHLYLDEKAILSLQKSGVIIGNHGSFHANLGRCNEGSLLSEIVENKKFIEEITKAEVKHYAIAFGKKEHFSKRAGDIIKGSGHEFIYSSNPVSFSSSSKENLIPRIGLTNNSTKEIMFYINRQFIKKIDL